MSRKIRVDRIALLCGASLLSLCAFASPATAQDRVSDEDELVVTGLRASLQSAQEIKRDAEVIVDSITAVDIGALPDRSVSEALQRISGVTLQRTNEARDPARLASEGGAVFIRGLSWVRSETNGRDIFSARNGRGLSFEDVSADLLTGVDVYKNPTANMIEGGIGGTVNLRTRLPFDSRERLIAGALDYNYGDLMEEGYTSGSVIFSDSWDTAVGRLGFLINYSASNVGNRTNSITTDRFDPVTRLDSSTVYHPKYLGWRDGRWEQEREALAVAAQWRPDNFFELTLQGFYSVADPTNIERTGGIWDATTLCPSSGLNYTNGVLTSGTMTGYHEGGWGCWPTGDAPAGGMFGTQEGITYEGNTRFGGDHKVTLDYSAGFVFTPNNNWTISGDLQFVRSTAEILSMTVGTQRSMLGTTPLQAAFNIGTTTPSLNITGANLNQPDEYYWSFAMDHIEDNEAESLAWRGDVRYDFENNGWLRSFEFGYRGTDKFYITRQSNWNWSILSAQYWAMTNSDGVNTYLMPVYVNDGTLDARLPQNAEWYAFDNFFRGDVQVPGGVWLPRAQLVSNGTGYANQILSSITGRPWPQGQGWGWSPASSDYNNYSPQGDNPTGGVTRQDENTNAIYAFLRFGNSNLGIPIDGNIGVRVVQTEASTVGRVSLPTMSSPVCPAANPADCTDFNRVVAFTSGGALAGVPYKSEYTEALPSLNLRAHLTDNLQLRFAASRAMVRPDFNQLQPFTELQVHFESDGYTLDNVAPFTGTAGNPTLRPIMADQFDVSLEWYFAPQGALTAVVFYKKISDYIYSGVSQQTFTNGGVTYTFDVTQQMNGDDGTVQGFEVGYQQFFDFLPGPLAGLGLQANYTYIDSDGGRNTAVNIFDPVQTGGANLTLPLEGMSPTSYNIALLYEQYGISARLAWNWREQYLLTTSAANINAPVWSDDYGQLDGSIFYDLTDNVKIGLQGTNLTQERTILRVGHGARMPRYSWVDTDRRIAAVLRARF